MSVGSIAASRALPIAPNGVATIRYRTSSVDPPPLVPRIEPQTFFDVIYDLRFSPSAVKKT